MMLVETCKIGMNYNEATDEVLITVPSATNYLEVLAIDIRNTPGMPDTIADVLDVLRNGIEQMEQEYREVVVDVSDNGGDSN